MKKYLELIRLPNVLTAASDSWAGYFIVLAIPAFQTGAGGLSLLRHVLNLILLVLASAALYSAGIIFNDIVDFERDKVARPQRPLPSGRISLNAAFAAGAGLAGAAILLCMMTGSLPRVVIGFALLGAVVCYNVVAKRSRYTGAPVMALCRALNIALGMGLTFGMIGTSPLILLAPAIMFAYIMAVTVASYAEESTGMAEIVVKWGVLGVALLDAVFLMAYGQMIASLFCLAALVGAVMLSKKFAVT